MVNQVWVGLDVGVHRIQMCVTDDQGVILGECDLDATVEAVSKALGRHDGIQAIGLESGSSTHLTRSLRASGFPVLMFDAFKASRYLAIRRNKTDINDARGLAEIARIGQAAVSQVQVRGAECESFRAKLKLRRGIIGQRMAAEGMLRALLRLHGCALEGFHATSNLRQMVERSLEQIDEQDPIINLTSDIVPLLEYCENVRRYLQTLNNELQRLARGNAVPPPHDDSRYRTSLCSLVLQHNRGPIPL